MSHDATKMLLGATQSSDKAAQPYDSDPATFVAGLAVRLGSDGLLTVAKGSNKWLGVSLGKSLSDTNKTSVLRVGSRVPVLLKKKSAYATVTITDYSKLVSGTDDVITVGATLFTAQTGAATPGDATFRAATSNDATATSLALQINSHVTAGALVRAYAVAAVVTIVSLTEGAAGNETIAITYTDNDVNIGATITNAVADELGGGSDDIADVAAPTLGTNVYFDDVTGKAGPVTYATTVSDAVYVSGVLTGIAEDGTSVPVALVDMIGGL